MKKERKHSIDKLFGESLAGHKIEPSAGTWESLATYIPSPGGRGTFMFLISGIVIGAFVFLMHGSLRQAPEQLAISGQPQIESTLPVSPETEDSDIHLIANTNTEVPANEPAITSSNTNSSLGSSIDQEAPPPAEDSKAIFTDPVYDPGPGHADIAYGYSSYSSLDRAEQRSATIKVTSTREINDPQLREFPEPIFDLTIKDSYVKKADVLFGAAFSPAVNIYPEGQNRNDFSLEFVAAYEKSRFILESGIGVNYTSESAKYQINYSSYDSVGFYVGVTSFNTAPGNPDSVIFETSLKNLYDSIDHFRIKENTNKFVYLQIPLRVGYRIFEGNRFSLDLKAGVLFSLQVYKDVPGVPYQGNDAEQIVVIRQYPDRLTTTWQYTAGIGMNYHINNNLRFTLEPFYRQYIKSAYSPASEFPARSPYSFGIRWGIYLHF